MEAEYGTEAEEVREEGMRKGGGKDAKGGREAEVG